MRRKAALTAPRASLILAAAGAYNTVASATAVDVSGCASVELFCTYTRGGASGNALLKVWFSDDGVTYYQRAALDAQATAGVVAMGTVLSLPVSAGATAETWALDPLDTRGAVSMKVTAAELGNTGAPGTLAINANGAL